MSSQRVTQSNSINAALQAFRDLDRKKLKEVDEKISREQRIMVGLAQDLLLSNPAYKQIKKMCDKPVAKLGKSGYGKDKAYLLEWSDGLEKPKVSGHVRLVGNQRTRAKRAFARIGDLYSKRRVRLDSVRDWKGRKMRYLKNRIDHNPELRDCILDICHIVFGSKSIPDNPCTDMFLKVSNGEEPAALPVSGGIDSGKMWESLSIGSEADPEGAASVLLDSFNSAWIVEFRKQLWIQTRGKEEKSGKKRP